MKPIGPANNFGAFMRVGLLQVALELRRRVASAPLIAPTPTALVLVTSTLVPCDNPLAYTQVRSIYGASRRLEQTCAGLDSVRKRVPGARVVLLENSAVTSQVADELLKRVDWLVRFDADPLAAGLRDGSFKGMSEAFMLASAMMALRRADYPVLLKLSGRYRLSDRFDLSHFPASGFGVHLSGGVPSTRLYSVAKDSVEHYIHQLRRALWRTSWGCGIEPALFHGVPAQAFHLMDVVGVQGLVAVSGMEIDE